jgi:hypothetical protein
VEEYAGLFGRRIPLGVIRREMRYVPGGKLVAIAALVAVAAVLFLA